MSIISFLPDPYPENPQLTYTVLQFFLVSYMVKHLVPSTGGWKQIKNYFSIIISLTTGNAQTNIYSFSKVLHCYISLYNYFNLLDLIYEQSSSGSTEMSRVELKCITFHKQVQLVHSRVNYNTNILIEKLRVKEYSIKCQRFN